MKHLVAAFSGFLLSIPAGAAGAGMVSYDLDLVFLGDSVLELVAEDGGICVTGDPCYPGSFRLPEALGGLFAALTPGQATTASLSFDPGDPLAPMTCIVAGWSDCGDLVDIGTPVAPGGAVSTRWIGAAGTTDLIVDVEAGRISYVGEAGSPFSAGCDLSAPEYPGLPAPYCDFFGYTAEFEITGFREAGAPGIPSVPVPPALAMLAAGLAGLGLFARRT